MAKTFVTDISEFVNAAGELRAMPTVDRRLAAFLTAIIEAETRYFPTTGHDTGMGCRKCGCQGTILASLPAIDGEIAWWCSVCKQKGVIRNWQGTKWDYTANKQPRRLPPSYTAREGQYLAFIYYYTKLHGRSPAEHDMQLYFRTTPPTVHDMVVKLDKHGLISREPGVPRSIRLLLKREELPDLE